MTYCKGRVEVLRVARSIFRSSTHGKWFRPKYDTGAYEIMLSLVAQCEVGSRDDDDEDLFISFMQLYHHIFILFAWKPQ